MKKIGRERVRARIKEVAARILQTQVKDPRMGFVTVTDCVLSPDYRHATLKVSILADRESEVRKVLRMLDDAKGFVQRGVAQALHTRVTPELRFELDKGAEKSVKIAGILDQLKAERESREGGEPAPPPAETSEDELDEGEDEEEFDGSVWDEYERGDADQAE